MAAIIILLIIAACAAFQFLKGTLIKAFAMIIAVICASMLAFGFFELLAQLIIGKNATPKFPALLPWAQPLSFILIFVLAFALLQTAIELLAKQPVNFGNLPEKIGRSICGIFAGLLIAGILLTALDMAPLPNKFPYQRFTKNPKNAENPSDTLFNADRLVTGWFSLLSKGAFSGKNSFDAVHPDFIDQTFLNRLAADSEISLASSSKIIAVPKKNGIYKATENLRDADGKPIQIKSGHEIIIVRVEMKRADPKDGLTFTPAQLRLLYKPKADAKKPLKGSAKNLYPIGFIKSENTIELKNLTDKIHIGKNNFISGKRDIDFAFQLPNNTAPTLIQFKQNNIAKLSQIVSVDKALPAAPFESSILPEKETKRK